MHVFEPSCMKSRARRSWPPKERSDRCQEPEGRCDLAVDDECLQEQRYARVSDDPDRRNPRTRPGGLGPRPPRRRARRPRPEWQRGRRAPRRGRVPRRRGSSRARTPSSGSAEIDARVLQGGGLPRVGDGLRPDPPERFAAFCDAMRWSSVARLPGLTSDGPALVSPWESAVAARALPALPGAQGA